MTGISLNVLSFLLLGFFLGMRHATDADHVVAIATIVSRERSMVGSALIGAAWGVGHTMTVMAVGAAIIGLAAGLATMMGDLWESMLKRRFGVKDSGDLIPGHGGLLDRVDGLMFATMVFAAARLIVNFLKRRSSYRLAGRRVPSRAGTGRSLWHITRQKSGVHVFTTPAGGISAMPGS